MADNKPPTNVGDYTALTGTDYKVLELADDLHKHIRVSVCLNARRVFQSYSLVIYGDDRRSTSCRVIAQELFPDVVRSSANTQATSTLLIPKHPYLAIGLKETDRRNVSRDGGRTLGPNGNILMS